MNDPAKNKKLAYTLGATSVIALSIGMNSCAIAQTRLDAIEVQVPTQKPAAKETIDSFSRECGTYDGEPKPQCRTTNHGRAGAGLRI